jgi:hypothetical protein
MSSKGEQMKEYRHTEAVAYKATAVPTSIYGNKIWMMKRNREKKPRMQKG